MGKVIGVRTPRTEDRPLLAGTGRFVDDIPAPSALHVAFVRSPLPHALVLGTIDAGPALAMPGVRAVLTLDSLSPALARLRMPLGFRSSKLPPDVAPCVLAGDEVAYVGQAVAMVLADDRYVAEDAASVVQVEYDPQPVVASAAEALVPDAPPVKKVCGTPVLARFKIAYGNIEVAFATAVEIVEQQLFQHRGAAHPIEGRGLLARFDPTEERLTVWSSTQMPHELYYMACEVLGLDENRLRVVTPDVGGGFGGKYMVYPEELAVIASARLLRRDVKWIEDRREHFLSAIQEREQIWSLEMALDADGRILGVRGRMVHDQGAYTLQDVNIPYNSATSLTGPYVVPACDLAVTVVQTNRVPVGTVRGAGYPEACFAMERLMDAAARQTGLDRAEIRMRNLIPRDKIPYERPLRTRSGAGIIYDSGDFPATEVEALTAADWAGFPRRKAAARAAGRHIGIGIAHGIKGTGRGPFESGLVRIMPSGRVSIFTGAAEMGQGLRTALAQICAEQLGLTPDDVTVVAGDTGDTKFGLGGFGSRQLVMAGSSVLLSARQVAEKARTLASHVLEAAPEDLVLSGGRVHIAGVPQSGMTLGRIAEILRGSPGGALPGDLTPGLEADIKHQSDHLAYADVCHVAEVEVDPETGYVHILRYVSVQDSGRLINPLVVDGQVHGAIAHGIGNALFEWMGYDEGGQPVTTNFAEYLLPTASELPHFTTRYRETPSPCNPLGAKGVGEVGTVPVAAAVIGAVEDALSEFGVRIGCAPVRPAQLVELIADAAGDPA